MNKTFTVPIDQYNATLLGLQLLGMVAHNARVNLEQQAAEPVRAVPGPEPMPIHDGLPDPTTVSPPGA